MGRGPVRSRELSAAALAAATPKDRDRYVDALRVGALGVVMLGHFLMAAVSRDAAGGLHVTNTLTVVPGSWTLTWVFQVMPVFFAVGGFSHAVALRSLQRRGGGYAEFVRSRIERLLRPTLVFVLAGLAIGATAELTGHDEGLAAWALRTVGQPLWFVGIYLVVVALAPPMLRLHRAYGWRVMVALVVAAAFVDLLRIGAGWELVGYLNFAVVWLAVHQAGFFYADGVPQRGGRRFAMALAAGGITVAVALVWAGPYSVSLISLPGERVSNLTPPSLVLLAFAAWLLGLVLLVRGPLTRSLQRGGVWTSVVVANSVVMTAFLWHLTAIVLVHALLATAGVPFPTVGGGLWWAMRLPLLGLIALVLAMLVAGLGRFEQPPPGRRTARGGTLGSALALAAVAVGLLGFAVCGFQGVLGLTTHSLVGLPMTAAWSGLLVVAGTTYVLRAAQPAATARSASE